jgi:valyl-tRNA synthetase
MRPFNLNPDRQEWQPSNILGLAKFPLAEAYEHLVDDSAEAEMGLVMECVRTTRNMVHKLNKVIDRDTLHECVEIIVDTNCGIESDSLSQVADLIAAMTRMGSVRVSHDYLDSDSVCHDNNEMTRHATKNLDQAVRPGITVRLPLRVQQGDKDRIVVEVTAQSKRLDKQLKAVDKLKKRLNSPVFMEKAPQSVQDGEHQKLADLQASLETLESSIETFKTLLR